jgi:hypothetical protein
MPNFIKEKSKNPSGNGEEKKEKTKIQQTPLYNHTHFSHILVCVTHFFGNYPF